MPFVFNGLLFGQQDVTMHKDLLFPFLHAHLKLVLLVLQAINMVGGFVQIFFDLLDLQLHDVMLHQHLFFLLGDLGEVLDGHVVLQR